MTEYHNLEKPLQTLLYPATRRSDGSIIAGKNARGEMRVKFNAVSYFRNRKVVNGVETVGEARKLVRDVWLSPEQADTVPMEGAKATFTDARLAVSKVAIPSTGEIRTQVTIIGFSNLHTAPIAAQAEDSAKDLGEDIPF